VEGGFGGTGTEVFEVASGGESGEVVIEVPGYGITLGIAKIQQSIDAALK
jgi:hypothetical protein